VKKLLICHWFGDLPEWFEDWRQNIATLEPFGFDTYIVTDRDEFAWRAEIALDVHYPDDADPRKACDYRCAFGEMFADVIAGYDFWGHTDLDCVYGRVERFVTDDFLAGLDIHSNHWEYVCGPWTLYRNTDVVNRLFERHPDWRSLMEEPDTNGWVETGYSELVDRAHDAGELRRAYTMWQTDRLDNFDSVRLNDRVLLEGGRERMMAHFRRTKQYPVLCR
jgi:hypothetical protein